MAEKLTKTEEHERAVKSLEINEHRLNVITRRIPELEAELQEAAVKQEIKGYAANTIKKLRDELNHLQSEKDSLEFSIKAMQAALPELKKQALIERMAAEGVDDYKKAKDDINTVLSETPSLDAFKSLVEGITAYADKLHHAKTMFLVRSKNLFDFMQHNKLNKIGSITENQLYQDRQGINCNTVIELCREIEKLTDLITEVRFSLHAAATNNPSEFLLPPPFDPDTVEQVSDCNRFMRKKDGNVWQLFHYGINGWGHQDWYRIYEGMLKPSYPNRKDEHGNWVIEFER